MCRGVMIWNPAAPTPLTDASWKARRPGLAVSRSGRHAVLCNLLSTQGGFARLDPETGVTEVISEERFDSFDLSPDGRRAVGVKGGDLTLINLEFLSSSPLQVNPGAMDALRARDRSQPPGRDGLLQMLEASRLGLSAVITCITCITGPQSHWRAYGSLGGQ